ncbi:MAG: hypothetical protein JWN70_2446, partial [Planctomycetaceae bacterium]|nr:hypothetical protein [Planctomycetaceae bacterium]
MDTGPFFSGTLAHLGGPTLKGLAIKLGDQGQASICYNTELLSVSCGWTGGFLKFSPSRFGLISPPAVDGTIRFTNPVSPGVSASNSFIDPRPKGQSGPLPRDFAHYEGLSLNGKRVVLQYSVGSTKILESPWVESSGKAVLFTREFEIGPSSQPVWIAAGDPSLQVGLVAPDHKTTAIRGDGKQQFLTVAPRSQSIRVKVVVSPRESDSGGDLEEAYAALIEKSPPCIDVRALRQAGASRWGEPLETKGLVSDKLDPYVIDTLTIPFENRYRALMFTSGLDFFANGDAAVCTAHGDVWLVSGIDEKLERITWRRFGTGLFQPLGLKIVKRGEEELVYVLGRDQISALHDLNHDGEADFYENFNNDGQA